MLAIKLTSALSSALSCALILSPVFFLVIYLVLCLVLSLMLASALTSTLSGAFTSVPSSVLSHVLPRALSSNLAIKLTSALSCAHFGIALSFPVNVTSGVKNLKHLYSPRKPTLSCNGLFQCSHQAPLILKPCSVLQVIKLSLGSQYSHSMITSRTSKTAQFI